MLPYKCNEIQNIFSLSVFFSPSFPLWAVACFQVLFAPSPSLYVLGSVISWFGFFFLPQAHCSSHLHHPPIPSSLMFCIVFFPSAPRILQVAFSASFLCLLNSRSVLFFCLKNCTYIPSNTLCTTMTSLQKLLVFGPCCRHLSSRCEKCMNICIIALRLDIDSITHGSVVECLNERYSLTRCLVRGRHVSICTLWYGKLVFTKYIWLGTHHEFECFVLFIYTVLRKQLLKCTFILLDKVNCV